MRGPSAYATESSSRRDPPKAEAKDSAKSSRSMWALFAVAGIVFAVGARLSHDRELARAVPAAPVPPAEARAPEAAPRRPPPPRPRRRLRPSSRETASSKVDPILPQEGPLRADDQVPPGQGMLEVVAGTSDTIFIDGTQVGNGPIVKRALAPRKEPYEMRVKLRGEERVRFVLVRENRLTRLRIAPPWSR